MFKKIYNISDQAIICDFGDEVSQKIIREVIQLYHYVEKKSLEGVILGIKDCIPSYNKLIINFDLNIINSKKIFKFLYSVDFKNIKIQKKAKDWIIPICYDFGIDLENISKSLKIDINEIINIHSKTEFFVYMIGFVPGHPFMGDLDSKLFLNRLKTPRIKVPAGSVGIVEKFCNIYPYESPGGWNIIGKTPLQLFNTKNNEKPSLLSPGDVVKFKSITKEEFKKINEQK